MNSWVQAGAWLLFTAAGDFVGIRWWRSPARVRSEWARLRASPGAPDPRMLAPAIVGANFIELGLIANAVRVSCGPVGPHGVVEALLVVAVCAAFLGVIGFLVLSYVIARTGRPRWLIPPAMRDEESAVRRRCAG